MTEPASGPVPAPVPPSAYPFSHPLRVRWAEVDAQGVVFNGHYLLYADICCTEYFRAAGTPQWGAAPPSGRPEDALDYYVVRATLDYKAPARFDDLLTLRGRISRLGRSSFTFECRMERGGEQLCTAEVVSVNAHAGASRPLPDHFREAVLAFEGRPHPHPD